MASFTSTICTGATSFSSRLCIPPAALLHFWRRRHTFSSYRPAPLKLSHFLGASKISLPTVKPKFIGWRSVCTRADGRSDQICEAEQVQRSHAAGGTVGKFQKRLRIADIKAGPAQGLERVGQCLSVRGWVRTCRVQRSITFIEACLVFLKLLICRFDFNLPIPGDEFSKVSRNLGPYFSYTSDS
ncbi:hypothetical protein SUGI_0173500 [Cryptomeria japonica]|nr:hypothetical protein SUGI_0173500 [Cryptomeria japonica]